MPSPMPLEGLKKQELLLLSLVMTQSQLLGGDSFNHPTSLAGQSALTRAGVEGAGSQPCSVCLFHGLLALLPPYLSLLSDPLPCPSRRSLGPRQPCCLLKKLCWSGASGRRPAMPMSTSPTSPTAGVTGLASAPSSTPIGVRKGEGPQCPPSPDLA